jgi:hypothetical protein
MQGCSKGSTGYLLWGIFILFSYISRCVSVVIILCGPSVKWLKWQVHLVHLEEAVLTIQTISVIYVVVM